jgi:NAD-dependent SIR2 family protein deacetylase
METLEQAARALDGASALLFTAGAGMGVDSGLPDFRGPEGFWNAYPAYRHLGLGFVDLAQPRWFEDDPELAWGFYGHRLELYRRTLPHAGFALLRRWAAARPAHVFTSNVDGQFQRAGFEEAQVTECHGSIHHLQCTQGCGVGIFSAEGIAIAVDEASFRARPPLPACPACRALARPNVLMFGDGDFDGDRTLAQERRLEAWLRDVPRSGLVVVECGAGLAIPTVRGLGDRLARSGATLVRVNVREPQAARGIAIALGAREALERIDALRGR